mmetsp:Transcript_17608/g.42976  ORF Transcript_17608/g.42976 Transcript_17608/m.42976 type:complete len:348 (+) Transcript_17608:113-1156(+)
MRPTQLPLLDMSLWRTEPQAFAALLRHACHTVGFFQLRHRLPSGQAERMMLATESFFALPEREKWRIDYAASPAFRGYMPLGTENTDGNQDRREQVEIAAEEGAVAHDAWPPYKRLRGPNQWPESLPELKETVGEYVAGMLEISRELTHALCLALHIDTNALNCYFEPRPHWQLKLAAYAPRGGEATHSHIGVGEHTDSGFLTLLLQDNSGGLQAFTCGEWIDVPPLGPDVIVCNLGEVAELLSGGYFLATPHRVLSTGASRLSVPYFHNPTLEAVVSPLELSNSLPWERDELYEEQHWRRSNNLMMHEYGSNAFKSLARSHPAVFAQHHSDLTIMQDGRISRKWNE